MELIFSKIVDVKRKRSKIDWCGKCINKTHPAGLIRYCGGIKGIELKIKLKFAFY